MRQTLPRTGFFPRRHPRAAARWYSLARTFLLPACALVLLGGCASVSVRPEAVALDKARPPMELLVADFTTNDAGLRVDRSQDKLDRFKASLTKDLRRDLEKALDRFGIPVVPVVERPPSQGRWTNQWLITGQVTHLEQGSRALRSVVGLGLGRTKFETAIQVYDLSKDPAPLILSFQTTGGSGMQPGGAFSLDPIGAGAGVVLISATSGLYYDRKRTARMIANYISEYLAEKGAIDPKKKKKAKIKKQ